MLFSRIDRTDDSPKYYCEPVFAHVDRRRGTDYDKIRDLVEHWFSHLPAEQHHETRKRFHSNDDDAFHAAFLEIFTHELLLRTKHEITFHPTVPETSRHPDFGVVEGGEQRAIVECKVVTEVTREQRGADARINSLYHSLEQIHSPDFFLDLHVNGEPGTPVPGRKWRTRIEAWLRSLNYDEIAVAGRESRFDDLPTLELDHDGLLVTISPISKISAARGRAGIRPIGVRSFEAVWVTSRYDIKDAVEEKATRYGEFNQPYVIVVNCIGEHCDAEEIECAFVEHEGLWYHKTPPSFTRLSAVLAIHWLFPWSIPRASIRLYHNPHARFPYTGALTQFPQAFVFGSDVQTKEGIGARELFGLEERWPRD